MNTSTVLYPAAAAMMRRSHVTLHGQGTQPMVFAHGFGCDQQMWRFVAPAFEATHKVILFDHVGCGRSDSAAWSPQRHADLEGYAADVVDILEALDLNDVIFVGHSVSSMIGVLAANRVPERFSRLVLVSPSPRYLNDAPHYHGGFEREDIEALSHLMEQNMVGWADYLAPVVMGAGNPSELADELKASFCTADPVIARQFASATFLGDNRADLDDVRVPSLVLQVEHDSIAPLEVGQYMHRRLRDSVLTVMPTTGHCPHMTHPAQTTQAIRDYLARATA